MKIFELEKETGLDRATIRYYEKEGFISPKRMENGYRDYSEEDREHLLKIRLLRQLGMSLDRIRRLQQGSEDFSEALSDQIRTLEQKIQTAQQSKAVCQSMLDANVHYHDLDAKRYLQMLSQPAPASVIKPVSQFKEREAREEYHPVRRYIARVTDYAIIKVILNVILIMILRIRPFDDFLSNLISYGAPFLAVPLMAFSLSKWGTTPGKWLMGIEVGYIAGSRLTFGQALSREWSALRYGYGFGIPFWCLWKLFKSYNLANELQRMPWDEEIDSEYLYKKWDGKKKLIFAAASILIIVLTFVYAFDSTLPKHRGDLTISEFSENYNFYLDILVEDAGDTHHLEGDGNWRKGTVPGDNSVIIESPFSKPDLTNFVYETKDGTISKITFDQKWTKILALNPLNDDRVIVPIVTAVMSQEGSHPLNLNELEKLLAEYESKEQANFRYKNIEISWDIRTENCKPAGNTYNSIDIEKLNGSLTIHLEIIIH